MHFNGNHHRPADLDLLARRRTPGRRRLSRSVATGVVALILISLVMPLASVSAAGTSGRTLLAKWSSVSRVSVVQESNRSIGYRGRWKTAFHAKYMGGKARATKTRGSKATLTFTGSAIAWVGPVGRTRGKARVYIDGRLVKTVNTRAASFRASRVLFTKSWSTVGKHKISIIANGTAGHPAVALDAFLVRRDVPTPAPAPGPGSSVRVTSIQALLTALADDSVTDIVVPNGTYRVSPAGSGASNSLWIGARFAGRTRPVTVRAETRGGVTFDGGGATAFGGLTFADGAHDQTWDGFNFANGEATNTGVIVFGGYVGRAAPHHITLRHIAILASCTGRAYTATSPSSDHAIYFSLAVGGPHDLLLEDITVDGSGFLASALQFYHSDSTNKNAWNVTVRRLTANRTQQPILMYDPTLRNILIDTATLTNAIRWAVHYVYAGTGIVLANVTSTGSGEGGFYSPLGSNPPGITFVNDSFK